MRLSGQFCNKTITKIITNYWEKMTYRPIVYTRSVCFHTMWRIFIVFIIVVVVVVVINLNLKSK